MILDAPFRAVDAVAAGLVTPGELRGPRFQRLFRGIYVRTGVDVDLALRSRAASLIRADGVLGGWSAAELLGASCGPADADVELVVPGGGSRAQTGLVVRKDRPAADEITRSCGVPVTTPLRTAFDLARRCARIEAVVALDALCRIGRVAPQEVVRLGYRHVGARGAARLPELVRLADPLAESPMETRMRLVIVDAGLPTPVLQHVVGRYRLDLAYPHVKLGVEYDGAHHRTADQALYDLERQAWLSEEGWLILRFRPAVVLRTPHRVPNDVARELRRRGERLVAG